MPASGVSILSQPAGYMPAYNPHWWVATSTNTAQPNFVYYIVVTDLITSTSETYTLPPPPTGATIEFNSGTFAETYMSLLSPDGLYGFRANTGSIRKIRVNIGERYDITGTPTVVSGSNVDYIVWNGIVDFLDFPSYSYTDYVWPKILTNNNNPNYTNYSLVYRYCNDEITFAHKRNYLTILGTGGTQPDSIDINGYDGNGNLLATTNIANPFTASANYYEWYTFIDVGYKGLENMPGAQIASGANPIPVSTFAYYDVIVNTIGNAIMAKRIRVECEPRYDIWTLHYLAKKGQWETINCSKLSEKSTSKTTSEFSKFPYALNGSNVYTYARGIQVKTTLNVDYQDSIKVNTDWLEDWQVTALKECFTSPVVFLDDGTGLVAVKIKTASYQEKKKYNSPLRAYSFDLDFSHINHRQRG